VTSVALVVPNLDHGRFLPAALDSVFDHSGLELKVAVMDAGSTDDSLAVIRRYADRLAYWRSGPDRGQASAINDGMKRLMPADYLGWLNADDLLIPEALHRLVAYLDAHRQSIAAFGRAHIVDETGHVIGEFPTRPFSRGRLAQTSIICQPASLIRGSAWNAVGGVDETLHMCLDYDLWWRLCGLGPIGFVDAVLACSRDHDATKTRTRQDRHYEEAFRVLRRHLGYVPWRWCVSETAYRWRQSHHGERVRGAMNVAVCGWRAVSRYVHVNGRSGLVRALHGP
jgi:GT2 family glycosyltransferase